MSREALKVEAEQWATDRGHPLWREAADAYMAGAKSRDQHIRALERTVDRLRKRLQKPHPQHANGTEAMHYGH